MTHNSSQPVRYICLTSQLAFTLGEELCGGGEGVIFEVAGDPSRAFKRYRRPTDDHRTKLEAMLRAVPDDPQRQRRNHVSICWPDDIVTTVDGSLAGFVMPRLDAAHRAVALYWNPEDRAISAPGFTWKHLCVAAANLASVVELVHEKGHVVGDLNDENVLVNDRALVAVVDCDSMQIRDPASGAVLRCTVGREPYVSPESLGRAFATFDRNAADDRWALAVLIFQLLMEGQHPTSGIGYPEERSHRIREGLFPFLGEPGFTLPQYAVEPTLLPEATRQLFERCFLEGHGDPSARPTAFEWRTHLQQLAGSLMQCPVSPLHWYPLQHAQCPWCLQRDAIGIDRFGGVQQDPAGSQAALPAAAAAPAAATPGTPAPGAAHRYGPAIAVVMMILVVLGVIARQQVAGARAREQQVIAQEAERREALEREHQRQTAEAQEAARRQQEALTRQLQNAQQQAEQQQLVANILRGLNDRPAVVPAPVAPATAPTGPALPAPAPAPVPAPPRAPLPLDSNRYTTSAFTIEYPSGWTARGYRDDPFRVVVYRPGLIRTQRDGSEWFDYSLHAWYEPTGRSTTLGMYTQRVASNLMANTPQMRHLGQQAVQTRWGPAIWTDLEARSEWNYIEYTRVLTIERSDGFVGLLLATPKEHFNTTAPAFDRMIGSLVFH